MSDTPPPAVPEPTPEPTPPAVAGTSSGATPAPAVAYESPGATLAADAADIEKNKVFALLSYLGILWLVPLLAAKDSPYAKFHCNQGILLSIVTFGGGIVFGVVAIIAGFVPFVGVCVDCVLWLAFVGSMLTLVIMGIVNALNGKMKPLPLFPVVTWVK